MKIWIDYDRMTNEQFQIVTYNKWISPNIQVPGPVFRRWTPNFQEKVGCFTAKGVACLKVRIREDIGTCPKQHDWLRKFIHIFHGHLKCFGCSTIFTHAVIKKQKHHAWRFASVAFCCHSCKGDNKVASSSSSSSSTTTTTNYSSTSHHLTISHKTSPIHHKLQSCFLLLKAAREKSDVCTKVKHHSHQRTVGFEAVGIPQIMCYPMLLLCRYLRDTHFLYTSSASSTNNSRLAYHTAVLWLVISTIMSFDYRFNYKLCIYIYVNYQQYHYCIRLPVITALGSRSYCWNPVSKYS